MRVEYINPFVETSFRVLQEVLGGAEVKRGDLYLKSTAMPVMGVAALVGLAGDALPWERLGLTLASVYHGLYRFTRWFYRFSIKYFRKSKNAASKKEN